MGAKFYGRGSFNNESNTSINFKDHFNSTNHLNIDKLKAVNILEFELYTKNMDRFNNLRRIIVQPIYGVKASFVPKLGKTMGNKFLTTEGEYSFDYNTRMSAEGCRVGTVDVYGEDISGRKIDLMIEPGDTIIFNIEFATNM